MWPPLGTGMVARTSASGARSRQGAFGRMAGGRPSMLDDGRMTTGPVDVNPAASDPADTGAPVDLARLTAVERDLADVEQALARLESGAWATCESCGGAIDLAALAERPASRRCAVHAVRSG